MASQLQARDLRAALEVVLRDQAGLARYEDSQRKVRRGVGAGAQAHPLQFDASGFPVPQSNSRLVQRIARMLDAR
jgi:hypothetical protein